MTTALPKEVGFISNEAMGNMIRELNEESEGVNRHVTLPWRRLNSALGDGLLLGTTSVVAGPPGNGKTYFALQACLGAELAGLEWAFLPCEMQSKDILRRLLAIEVNSWEMFNRDRESAGIIKGLAAQNAQKMSRVAKRICENPRKTVKGLDGKPYVPGLPYQSVLDWIAKEGERLDLIVIDPISMLDYDIDRKSEWKGQQDFVQMAVNIASDVGVHLMLVAHVGKRQKTRNGAPVELTGDDVQGSAAFFRFTDYVMLLDSHDPRESEVFSSTGRTVYHARTMFIAKSRWGSGTGKRIAFDFSKLSSDEGKSRGPRLEEHGIIVPKKDSKK